MKCRYFKIGVVAVSDTRTCHGHVRDTSFGVSLFFCCLFWYGTQRDIEGYTESPKSNP